MPEYQVTFRRAVVEEATVLIQAPTAHQAIVTARQDPSYDWHFHAVVEGPYVLETREQKSEGTP